MKLLRNWFNDIIAEGTILDEWQDSVLVPIYNNEGDIQDCKSYRSIKLISHTMKILERLIEKRLRDLVYIGRDSLALCQEEVPPMLFLLSHNRLSQYRKHYTEKIQIQRKPQNLHCAFIDLEKTYDCVSRKEVWNY